MMEYEYKDSGVESLGEMPEHWRIHKIKKSFSVKPSNVNKKSVEGESSVKLCNYVDVYYNDYIDSTFEFMEATASEGEIKKFSLLENDVLITKDSEDPMDIGVPALIKQTQNKLLCGYHLSILRSKTANYSGKFLFWVLKDLHIASQLHKEATGITRWAIASRHIKNTAIPLPPLPEQQAIAVYLDKACTRIDRIIEIKEKQLEQIEEYYFSLLDSLFTCKNNQNGQNFSHFIDRKIPLNWKIDRLKDVAIINEQALGSSTPKDYELDYLDIGNVNKQGIVDKNKIKKLKFGEAPSRAKRITKKGDTIISSVRTNLQAVAYIDFEAKSNLISSTGLFVCRPKSPEQLNPEFLYYFLLTSYSKDYFFSRSTGVSYPAIDDYEFGSIYIFIPTPLEQNKIVDRIKRLKLKTEKLGKKLNKQITTLKDYRKSLIHECVTGKKQVYFDELNVTENVYAGE